MEPPQIFSAISAAVLRVLCGLRLCSFFGTRHAISSRTQFVIPSEAKDLPRSVIFLALSTFSLCHLPRPVISRALSSPALCHLPRSVILSGVRRQPNAVEGPCVLPRSVILSGVRRQPNAVEGPCVLPRICHPDRSD